MIEGRFRINSTRIHSPGQKSRKKVRGRDECLNLDLYDLGCFCQKMDFYINSFHHSPPPFALYVYESLQNNIVVGEPERVGG